MRRTRLFASLLALGSLALSASVAAAPQKRVQVDQRGDFLLIGNVLSQDCAVGTPAPIVGTVGACGTNTADSSGDVFWRSDDPSAGLARADNTITNAQARSTAVLTVPVGASVTHAYLYWSGTVDPATNPVKTLATIERPGVFSQPVTASAVIPGSNNAYQSVADITSLVQANGSGAYRVGGVASDALPDVDNNNKFIGWYMVVFYTNPADPLRNLALFDGMDAVSDTTPQTITLSGFLVPTSGYGARLGVVAFEGDSTLPGDQLLFNGSVLSNGLNPANDFFNGTRSFLGVPVTTVGDLPQLSGVQRSLTGIDMDIVDVTALVGPSDTSATLNATSTGDVYHLAAWITSVSTFKPDFATSTKTVVDVNGEDTRPGDELEYTIVVTNTGNDTSVDTVLTDPIPVGTTFVPGSLEISAGANAGVKTDAGGDDQGEVAGGSVVVRLGTGADATSGGTLAINESTTVKFRVVVGVGSGVISNQATIAAAGLLGAPTGSWVSAGPGGVGTPTTIPVDECSTDADCGGLNPTCDTTADPHVCTCVASGAETCDGDDNDCNGTIDDGFDIGMACSSGVGACEAEGTIQCVSATASACDATPGTPAEVETCGDDVDANCDGDPSDGCPPPAECQRDYECAHGEVCDDTGMCIVGCRTALSDPGCQQGYLCIGDEGEDIGQCEIATVSTEGGGLGGCSASASGDGSGLGWLALLGLPALFARRRRRR